MSEHKAKSVEGLVTSDAVQGNGSWRSMLSGKGLVAVVAVAVIVLGAVGGALYKVYVYDPAHKKTSSLVNRNSNDYLLHPDKQVSAAQEELKNAKTPQQKAVAYNHLAQAYMNAQKPTDAVDAANNSLSADSSTTNKLQALNALGYAYSRAGEKDKAIASFQQMIDLMNASGDASMKQDIPRVQSAIDQIKQGQNL